MLRCRRRCAWGGQRDSGRPTCLAGQVVARGRRLWGFDDQQRRILFDATEEIPTIRSVLARAEQRADLDGLWVLQATVRELDEIYSLVEALMDCTRGRKKLDLLEGLLSSLCTSIDGF